MILWPFGSELRKPRIINDGAHLGDNPMSHRWRATWDHGDGEWYSTSICLTPHKVVRVTRCGVWIELLPGGKTRWVFNDRRQAWAKPTRAEALESIAIRLSHWSHRLRNDVDRVMEAAYALKEIAPQHACDANAALSHWQMMENAE